MESVELLGAESALEALKRYYRKISYYDSAISLLHWDMQTYMPKAAAPFRAQAISEISKFTFELATSDELLKMLESVEPRNDVERALVEVGKKELERMRKIPPKLFERFVQETTICENIWEDAKHSDDYSLVKPHFQKVVELTREIAEHLGYERDPYDALLDKFEPGMKTETLKPIFSQLRDFIGQVLNKIESTSSENDIFTVEIGTERQKRFSEWLLDYLQFDRTKGRLDASEHPFTSWIGLSDVRITTRYIAGDLRNSIFSTLHEFGHATYTLGIPEELYGLPIGTNASFGFDESQSRFWENIVGRSLSFWKGVHAKFVEFFPEFSGRSPEELWRAVNRVERSYIRTEADEVTYNLHIILRFELEHALINGELSVGELPAAWNERFEKYFGIAVPSDRLGCLQDPHWYGGAFGYFPSYTLGNLYAAQIKFAMEKELELERFVETGDFEPIKAWLKDKVHVHGRVYKPGELLRLISGEELNIEHFKDYITSKFSQVYGVEL